MNNYCDCSFDKDLSNIQFLKDHPSYMPYIGVNYKNAKLKILHVGNTHYIEPSQDPDNKYGFDFFYNNWFSNPQKIKELPGIYDFNRQMKDGCDDKFKNKGTCKNAWNNYCINTRSVITEVLSGKRNDFNLKGKRNYAIFTSVIKVLSKACGSSIANGITGIDRIRVPNLNTTNNKTYEKRLAEYEKSIKAYTYVAFTDFHMFPALEHGNGYVNDRLLEAAENQGVNNASIKAEELYNKIVDVSAEVLDEVIEIIQPDIIFITSKKVGEIYREKNKLKQFFKEKIYCDRHPNSIRGSLDDYIRNFKNFI